MSYTKTLWSSVWLQFWDYPLWVVFLKFWVNRKFADFICCQFVTDNFFVVEMRQMPLTAIVVQLRLPGSVCDGQSPSIPPEIFQHVWQTYPQSKKNNLPSLEVSGNSWACSKFLTSSIRSLTFSIEYGNLNSAPGFLYHLNSLIHPPPSSKILPDTLVVSWHKNPTNGTIFFASITWSNSLPIFCKKIQGLPITVSVIGVAAIGTMELV